MSLKRGPICSVANLPDLYCSRRSDFRVLRIEGMSATRGGRGYVLSGNDGRGVRAVDGVGSVDRAPYEVLRNRR